MNGLLVAWGENEIQAIDEDNFKEMVVTVTEQFFKEVKDPTSVSVVWRTETRDHQTRYDVTQPPQLGLESCYVDIKGNAPYRIELDPEEMSIRQCSNDWVEELSYLEFRTSDVAVDNESNTISLEQIAEEMKKKAVRAAPDIEW